MKGNKKAQRQRRKERRKNLPEKKKEEYKLIDGNFSHFIVAYCCRKKSYLTRGLIETHKCAERGCIRLKALDGDEK